MLWTVKHAPKTIDEIAGNDEAKTAIKKWALEWSRGKRQKPLLVYGPSGVGKTSLARAMAGEFGWILVETGSSEVRSTDGLQKQFGESSMQGLFGKRLLFIDDLDSVFDRGETQGLMALMENAAQPLLLCANDIWDPKLAKIREECVKVELKKINKTSLKKTLNVIAEKEKTSGLENAVEEIAENSSGDLRAAIIDLQSGTISEREREQDVFKNLIAVFKGSFNEALETSPHDFDLFMRWVEENIPIEYETAGDVAEAFQWFSKADVFRGRVAKRQDYGLMLYARALTLGGVASAKKQPYKKFSRYQFPSLLKSLSRSKGERQGLKQISLKAAAKLHCSSKQALETLLVLPKKSLDSLEFTEDEKAILEALRT